MGTPQSVHLGDFQTLAEGDLACVAGVGSYGIVLARVDGELYALDDNCSLCDVPLSNGTLAAHRLSCAQHDDWFDVRDGMPHGAPAPVIAYQLDGPEHALRVHLGSE